MSRYTTFFAILVVGSICHPSRTAAEDLPAPSGSANDLDLFYDRLAQDLEQGNPMVVTVHVALCDNDSQGIVPVKNGKICNGDDPSRNLYWSTSGGLKAWARKNGWRRVHRVDPGEGPVLVEAVWKKRLRPGGALRERGVKERFDVYLVGLAYRGREIERAMIDYLEAVNRDHPRTTTLSDGTTIRHGGASHLVGYIGHDYFMDVYGPSEAALMERRCGDSTLAKGTFALACAGDSYIRPAITRPNVYVLILNKQLAYPGAWTVGGIVDGIAAGATGKGVHRSAARAFATGMERGFGAILRSFAYGP